MKHIHTFFFLLFISLSSLAQTTTIQNDDDKDGISNSEDACPNVAGTKANNGCPEKATSTTEFIPTEVFTKLMDAVCAGTVPSLASTQKLGDYTVTNLPMIGKEKHLPIIFAKSPTMNYLDVICILSNKAADYEGASYEILNKLKNYDGCNKMFAKVFASQKGDTIYLMPQIVAGKKYYEFLFFPEKNTIDSNFYILFKIIDFNELITKTKEAEYNAWVNQSTPANTASTTKEETKPVGIKDKKFKQEIDYIISEAKNGYVNNKLDLFKKEDKWYFKLNLKWHDFESINISVYNTLYNLSAIKTFNGKNHEEEAKEYFKKLTNKIQENFKYDEKEEYKIAPNYYGFDYSLKKENVEDISIDIKLDEYTSTVSLTSEINGSQIAVENSNSMFGLNASNYEKLKSDIVEKLMVYYREGSTSNGLSKYANPNTHQRADNLTSFNYASEKVALPFMVSATYEKIQLTKPIFYLSFKIDNGIETLFEEVLDKMAMLLKDNGVVVKNSVDNKGNKLKKLLKQDIPLVLLEKFESSWRVVVVQQ